MSIEIQHLTINGEDDGQLVIGNAQIAASLSPLGSNWNRIRIGLRLSFEDTGTNITGTPRFYIGMLSNPSSSMENGPLTIQTSNFVGYYSNSATWTRTAGTNAGAYLYNTGTNTGWAFIQRSNNSNVLGTSNHGGTTQYVSSDTGSCRTVIICELIRSANGFSGSFVFPNSTKLPDVPLTNFLGAMEIPTITACAAYLTSSYSQDVTPKIIANESSGSLNAICVAWDRLIGKVHISDIAWTNFSS